MNKIPFFFLICIHICFAQQEPDLFNELKKSFVAFEYEKSIALAGELLQSRDSLASNTLVEVLRMQAIAYFSLDELRDAKDSFIQILIIKPNYTLDESETSPKIIAFFDDVKLEYLGEQMVHSPEEEQREQEQLTAMQQSLQNYKKGIFRSLIFPGWGHYYLGEANQGLILNVASLLTLAPGLYFAVKTNKYEDEYLKESYDKKIQSRYSKYNNAYKNRNYFLSAFAVIWLYAQYDYFYADHNTSDTNSPITLYPQISDKTTSLILNINF